MEITKTIVQRLLKLIGGGLQHGAGEMDEPGTFCVQQAVSMATEVPEHSDTPIHCVNPEISTWGVVMNDKGWSSPKARADGMRRFAVAELGSKDVSSISWSCIVLDAWNSRHPDKRCCTANEAICLSQGDAEKTELCNIAAKALEMLGSEGSKYLYLCDPETPKEHKDMMNRIYNPLPQLQWRNFNAQSEKGYTRHLA